MPARPTELSGPAVPVDADGVHRLLSEWEAAGLVDAAQCRAIEAFEAQRTSRPLPPPVAAPAPSGAPPSGAGAGPGARRVPAAAEALGYLGGILALVGVGLLLSRVWDELGVGGRLTVLGAASAVLVAAGAAVRVERDAALRRLRGFLWLLSTLAATAFGAMVASDVADAESGVTVGAAAAGVALVHAGGLWRWRSGRPLQQGAALIALPVLVGCLVALVAADGLAALTVWVVGVAVFVAGMRRSTPTPGLTTVLGAATLLIGSGLVSADWQAVGLLLTVVSAIGVIAVVAYNDLITDRVERWAVALVGSVALFQAVPSTLLHFADRSGIATGLVTWAVGVATVAIGVRARDLRGRPAIVLLGGLTIVGGAALCAVESVGFATLFGLVTAIVMVALGTRPGTAIMSLFGSLGLLINVPWAVNWFFPGEGRAPLLILVSGLLIIAVAVFLARSAGRIRAELGDAGNGSAQVSSQARRRSSAA